MEVVRDVASLRAAVRGARARGERIGFVPTMGALHAGHLSLIARARAQCACVVLSIFVNPLQFAPTEDLAKYPRTEQDDLDAAAPHGATIAFVPTVDVMYPGARVVSVVPESIADRWEGAIRPGHFAGVLTVVTKLLNLVQPDVAVFGQKDLQQATLIRALVRDLDIPVTLDIAPIVREADGLAMSSRNRFLDTDARRAASVLSQSLAVIGEHFAAGERNSAVLLAAGDARLASGTGVLSD
jgi:pantoate--beta-alanine ligase